ncbi:MAG: type IX secretion system outer membrane channel protein PorV [Pyrinomonadaceae bacterium]|nr:type IX secretion system outer membrane channel protein PorV [Sphingobacteriaceae bacterium]
MKKATLKLTAAIVLIAVAINNSQAQTADQINVVTTAVPFLRISPDARSGGMGDVGIATSADAYSSFYNLGKIIFAKSNTNIGVTYTPWLSDLGLNDVYLASISGFHKLDENSAISGGLRYFSLGNIQFTDANGNQLQSFRPREFGIDLGYVRKLSDRSGLGLGIRYINSDLAGGTVNGISYKKGTSVAADLHYFNNGLKEDGSGLNWGVTLSNLGSKISYTEDANQRDYIPANLGLGVAYTKVFDADSKITFALDLNKLLVPTPPTRTGTDTDSSYTVKINDYRSKGVVSSWFSSFGDAEDGGEVKEITASIGAEYWYKEQFALRLGYFYENPDKGNRKYFTVGAGLRYNTFGLNFSYLLPNGAGINRNPLSNTLRFSLFFDLDNQ